jgi:hypothetical protein
MIVAGNAGDERTTAAPLDEGMRFARCWPELREVAESSFEQKFFVIPETIGDGIRADANTGSPSLRAQRSNPVSPQERFWIASARSASQ